LPQVRVAEAADILSNNNPVQVHTHMDVLNKLAGLHMADVASFETNHPRSAHAGHHSSPDPAEAK